MTWSALLVIAIFLGALYLFAKEVMRPDMVGLLVMAVLMVTRLVTIEEGVAGFSNPAVITVVMMFLLSAALVRTGVADAMGRVITWAGGAHPIVLMLVIMVTVGLMSCFMNNIAATVILLPAVLAAARKTGVAPTKLLIPLSFGSLLGGLCTLIGTPPNLLANIALESSKFEAFKMFDYLPTGIAVFGVAALYFAVAGYFILPSRETAGAKELVERYQVSDYLSELVIPGDSPLIGKPLGEAQIKKAGLDVLKIIRGDLAIFLPSQYEMLRADDVLVVEGSAESLLQAKDIKGVRILAEENVSSEQLTSDEVMLGEISIPPNSVAAGRSLRDIQFRTRYGAAVLAIRRGVKTLHKTIASEELHVGDILLAQGTKESMRILAKDPNFLVVGSTERPAVRPARAWTTVGIMAFSVTMASLGWMHISLAALMGVLLMVAFKCLKPEDMYKEIEWRVIFLIAGMIPLSTAMQNTGVIESTARFITWFGGAGGPYVAFALLFVVCALLTQVLSNAAVAVIFAPIAVQVAAGLGVSPYPLVMAVAIACSTAFLTPIGHQSNVLVYGLGGYQFNDFPRVGAPLSVAVFLFCMWWVPRVWPFLPVPIPAP